MVNIRSSRREINCITPQVILSESLHLVVVEVAVDGEAMAPDLPLVARRPSLASAQDSGVALRPEELRRAVVFCRDHQ